MSSDEESKSTAKFMDYVDSPAAFDKPREVLRATIALSKYDSKIQANPVFKKLSTIVEKAGYLNKQGGNWKSWKKRYFFLSGPFVTYYTDEDDPSPKGVIILINCEVEISPTSRWGKEFCFEIKHPDRRTFVMQASSEQHRDSWVAAFREGIEWPSLIPDMLKQYEEMEVRLSKSKVELKKSLDQQDELRKTLIELQRQVDDNRAIVSLFNFKMDEKESELSSKNEEIELLRKENKKLQSILASGGGAGGASQADVKLMEKFRALESEKDDLSLQVAELTDKYNKKRAERELLRKEVIRLRQELASATGSSMTPDE